MGEQPVFVLQASSQTLLTSAAESLLREHFPEAEVRREPLPAGQRRSHSARVVLAGTGRWVLLGADISALEASEAIAAGAWGILPLDAEPGDFQRGMAALVDGEEPFFPVELMQKIADRALRGQPRSRNGDSPTIVLTAREREVLALVAMGCSNAEIAAQLHVSANTVRTHLQSLFAKFQAQGRLKMVARARELGLLDTAS